MTTRYRALALHPHWTASEAVVSALDYKGMKMAALDGVAAPAAVHLLLRASWLCAIAQGAAPTTLRFKGACSHIELQGCCEMVGPAGIAPASSGL